MDLKQYQDYFQELVKLEQEEEMKHHKREIKHLSGHEREQKGRCLTEMTAVSFKKGVRSSNRVTFRKSDGATLPDLEISVGDLIQISRDRPLNDDNPTGTVWDKSSREITVSFPSSLPEWTKNGPIRLDQYVDNVTFQRMLDAIFLLNGLSHEQLPLRNVILQNRQPEMNEIDDKSINWVNRSLNSSQRDAVKKALASEDLFLVHGPPGTGKTMTMTEIIAQGISDDKSILATAPSNVAVDNLLDSLIKHEVDVVRIGHPARALPTIRDYTLDKRLEDTEIYRESQKKREKALDLIEQQKNLTTPSGKWRRGLDDEEIHHLAKENRSSRGLSTERIREMSEFLNNSDRIDMLFEESDRLEDRAIKRLIESVDVVCATNTTAGSDILAGHKFDWVCIDEATQATEPSCLIPITKGKKLVMAGDHRQLPPTVLSEEAQNQGLSRTLFERMHEAYDDKINSLLVKQYRMHQDIMGFSNKEFYDNKMKADLSVKNHTLRDLSSYHPESINNSFRQFLRERPILTWIDTSGSSLEQQHSDSPSLYNREEGAIVTKLVNGFLESGLDPSAMAVISPYKAQVELLNELINTEQLQVDTVDGFQGQEKEVVILSFVRSNSSGSIGFLSDERRLNVSLTRARRKLIIVGDTGTLEKHTIYESLKNYVELRGQLEIVHEVPSIKNLAS